MLKNVLSVAFYIPGDSDVGLDFRSDASLLDADIVVFRPALEGYERDYNEPTYNGLPLIGKNDSFKLTRDVSHWRSELKVALEAGKTVFVACGHGNGAHTYRANRNFRHGTERSTN